ncbi:hypothetical protein KEJ32_04060 [Candidatus Bathyarchaeota archaeon]|nr:hypothetical protein [Candidatus Bathyarchaeota archaeon]
MRAKKNQIWFETNLGYEETKDRLFKSGLVVGDDQDFGRFSFKLKNFKDYSVQITRGGKLGTYYPVGCSYEPVLESLRSFLVTPEGEQAEIFDVITHSEETFH